MPMPNGTPYHWELLKEPFFCVFHGTLPQGCFQTLEEAEKAAAKNKKYGAYVVKYETHAEHEQMMDRLRNR